jgi:hypothetical protein
LRLTCYILAFIYLGSLFSCRSSEAYKSYAASIDSLGGAIGTLETQLKAVNEAELADMKNRYLAYSSFIRERVTDTLSQAEASDLRRFDEAGKQLELFVANRQILVERAGLVRDQLETLAKDVRTKSADEDRIREYLSNEKAAAADFAEGARSELASYTEASKQFRISLAAVGNIIRKRNDGELPRVISNPNL